jgi:hypothetical protein
MLTAGQLHADAMPPALTAVPCTAPHNFELTETGLIPAGMKALAWAGKKCSWLNVNRALGVNRLKNDAIKNPLRVSSYYFTDGGTYQCGAGVTRMMGRGPAEAEMLSMDLKSVIKANRAWLRVCYSAAKNRLPNVNPVTVPCGEKPVWVKTYSVDLSSLGKTFPGETRIQQLLGQKCGRYNYGTWANIKEWSMKTTNYGSCYIKA